MELIQQSEIWPGPAGIRAEGRSEGLPGQFPMLACTGQGLFLLKLFCFSEKHPSRTCSELIQK